LEKAIRVDFSFCAFYIVKTQQKFGFNGRWAVLEKGLVSEAGFPRFANSRLQRKNIA
jgi:hypothetical protein